MTATTEQTLTVNNYSGANRIAVDWDGTCVESAWPAMGDWLPGAVAGLRELVATGLDVVIFSTRLAPTELDEETPRPAGEQRAEVAVIRAMLDAEDLSEVEVWTKPWKPGATLYVDDKALRFEGNWNDVTERVLGGPTPERHPNSARFHEILGELAELHDRKQADYGRGGDPFANVRASSEWGVPAWVGAMVRGTDKIRRLQSLIANGALQNESAEDSLRDLAVYTVIALVLFEQEQADQRETAFEAA